MISLQRQAIFAAAVAVALTGGEAADPSLPAAEAVRVLADGKPWNGTRSDGDHVQLTFNPDGTGRFQGPVTRPITWKAGPEEICIQLGFPMGDKCLRFRRRGATLQAFLGDDLDMTFSR